MPALRTIRLLICIAASLTLLACASTGRDKAPSPLQGAYPAGTPHYRVEQDNLGRKHGTERWWYEDGTLKIEATWIAGGRDGSYRAWYASGTPWYSGRDSLGISVDTLRYWHPNGQLHTLSVFRDGVPHKLEEYDTTGLTPEEARLRAAEEEARLARVRARAEAQRRVDSLEALEGPRRRALAEWVPKARATVETYWNLPDRLKKKPLKTTARLRVAASGAVLAVAWPEKSGSSEFDRHAARALEKVRKFPPLPAELGTEPIELRYEFTTPGLAKPRKKLQLRDPERAMEEG